MVTPVVPELSVNDQPQRRRKGEPAAALALARGASITDAAIAGGISEKTIRRRLASPAYKAEVAQLRSDFMARAVGKLADSATEAVTCLRDLLSARSETVRLGAAKAVLDLGISLSENVQTAERIAVLERTLLATSEEIHIQKRQVRYG